MLISLLALDHHDDRERELPLREAAVGICKSATIVKIH